MEKSKRITEEDLVRVKQITESLLQEETDSDSYARIKDFLQLITVKIIKKQSFRSPFNQNGKWKGAI